MRLLTAASLLAAMFASSSAFAQHVHHKYCLRTEGLGMRLRHDKAVCGG
jgi:hypothetical protein